MIFKQTDLFFSIGNFRCADTLSDHYPLFAAVMASKWRLEPVKQETDSIH